MTTKNLIPRASGEGGIGITDVTWGYGYYDTGNFNKGLFLKGSGIEDVIANTVTQGGLGGEWTKAVNGFDIYYNGGNVGIGTTDPGAKLDVDGVGRFLVPNGGLTLCSFAVGATTTVNQPVFALVTNETNNQDRVRFNSDGNSWFNGGNVGIGTTDPSSNLHVNDISLNSGNLGTAVRLECSGSNNQFVSVLNVQDSFFVKANGNVGIGTSNPSQKLDIHGKFTVNSDGTARWGNIPNGIIGRLSWDGGAIGKIILRAESNNTLSLGANGNSDHIVIDTDGNVGIGTTNPDAKLDINGTLMLNTTPTSSAWKLENGVNTLSVKEKLSSGSFAGRVSFLQGGNVGIGTSIPDNLLHVMGGAHSKVLIEGGSSHAIGLQIKQSLVGGGQVWQLQTEAGSAALQIRNGTSDTVVQHMNADGKVGIGTSNPISKLHAHDNRTNAHSSYALQVQNDGLTPHGLLLNQLNADPSETGPSSGYSILATSGATQCFFVLNNGDTFNRFNNYGQISDKRLKENITDATAKTEDLKKVRVVNYNLIEDDTKQIGVIAQELEQVFPGLVSESEHQDGETYKSVKMSLFVPMLLKGFQEQQQLIEDLKSRIETLENK
jgi:hypothetical protein